MPRFEYEVSSVEDDESNVNAHMREREEMGWTLVSGSAVTFKVSENYRPVNMWHTRYIMYWQRP